MKQSRIPEKALSQHVAIVGKTGSGKTFRAKGEVERLLGREQRVCIIDPTGAWWGLKASADGKAEGFPVVIFGGEHADVPINQLAGEALGKLIGETNTPSIIDLSDMGTNARHRFAEHFFESLYQHNRGSLYLITDEADEFAPQSGPPGTERMLGAFDRIVRRGRIKGFRVWMISQRPAVLNKNVLTQANTLIAMRLPSSQDRKAVELWVKGQADESKACDMMASLASLPRGRGWIWAPEQSVLECGDSADIKTFDSSRTPDDGEKVAAPRRLADVDLTGIREAMAAAIDEAQANDPKALRSRAEKAEAEVRALKAAPTTTAPSTIQAQQIAELQAREKSLSAHNTELYRYGKRLRDGVYDALARIEEAQRILSGTNATEVPSYSATAVHPMQAVPAPMPIARPRPVTPAGPSNLAGPEQRILDAAAFFASIGEASPRRAAVAIVAGYSSISGGAFSNPCGALRAKGLITYPSSETLAITAEGLSKARAIGPASLAEFHQTLLSMLPGPEARILRPLIENGGRPMSREENARAANYGSITGGAYSNPLGSLRSRGFIDYPDRSSVVALPVLFPNLGGAR